MSRGTVFHDGINLVTEECCACGTVFAMAQEFKRQRLRDRTNFYCPAGHSQAYVGDTDAKKLEREKAKNTHLEDQLLAAAIDAEKARSALIKDRHRIANGVCPCCNRYFTNVHRHIRGEHPDFDPGPSKVSRYKCGCGRSFESPRGLAIHQSRQRGSGGWYRPNTPAWRAHLTVVPS